MNAKINIFLPIVPALSVNITSTGILTERLNYTLTCTINGVGPLKLSSKEYQWEKDGENISSSPTLNFTPLTLNDNGTYTCTVNITSSLLNETRTTMNAKTLAVSRKSANFKWIIDINNIIFFVDGLYFTLNGTTYSSGATVPITSIGASNGEDAGSSLVCVTSYVNTMCCRAGSNINHGGGPVGNWLWPNSTIVLGKNANPNGTFTRSFHNQQIRLNRKRTDVMSPTGVYTCVVPDNTTNHTANITLCEYIQQPIIFNTL